MSAVEIVKKHLRPGDLITHTVCMGELQEHVFTGYDGNWLCGKPTKLTVKYGTCVNKYTNDISPDNITHINRQPVECLDFLIDLMAEVNKESV